MKAEAPAPRRGLPLIERAIAAVSPRTAVARARDRILLATLSGYEGAKSNRPGLRGHNPRPRSADEDTLPQLDVLRARSRDLVMNAPLAGGAIKTVVTNVVGTGLTPSASDRSSRGERPRNACPSVS
jgi:capsid protein